MRSLNTIGRLLMASGVVLVFSAQSEAMIHGLGTIGGAYSAGRAVNASGEVAGFSFNANGHQHAFLHRGTPGGGGSIVDLGTLGGLYSDAYAINASGQVVGSSTTSAHATRAFRYTGTPGTDGVMHDLGTLGGRASYGYALNDSGQVAGNSFLPGDTSQHAFLYTGTPGADGVMHDLGTLGGSSSIATAINAAGQVAGWSDVDVGSSVRRAFRYTGTPGGGGGVMVELGTLGGAESFASAINDSGQVAGYSATLDSGTHAFLYTGEPGEEGVMADLGTLGGTQSEARAINARGQVAGFSFTANDAALRAFLYTGTPGVDGVMIDLDAWLDAADPQQGAHWTLTSALGLTDLGLITGTGVYDDGPGGLTDGGFAFLLDVRALVPEPASLAVIALGATVLYRRRFKRVDAVLSSAAVL